MKTTITKSEFTSAFHKMGRGDNFSHQGLLALYDWFEEYEECTGSEVELDVIAICCDFNEYADLEDFHGDYDSEDYPDIDTIRDHTQVIEIPNSEGFIIQAF